MKPGTSRNGTRYDGDPHHFRAYVGRRRRGGAGELEEFRRVLSSVKRLSSWLDDIITITAMDPDMVTFTGTMGKGYTSTPLPEAAVDYHLEDMIRAGGAFGTITQTAIPAAI